MIFTTSEIEKEEFYNSSNSSSIILGDSEQYIYKLYSTIDELPIPIFKSKIVFSEIYKKTHKLRSADLTEANMLIT